MLVGIPRSDGWRDDGERGGFSARTRYAMSPDSRFLFLAYGGKIHRIDIESGKDEILPFRARVNQCLDPLNRFQFEANRKLREIKSIRSITASPDESQLVFSALRRSEEHTSELQSLMRISYAVFCLKKKKKDNI